MSTAIREALLTYTGKTDLNDAVESLVNDVRGDAPLTDASLSAFAKKLQVSSIDRADLPCDATLIPHGKETYRILVSNESSKARTRFSIAHELGHILLHRVVPETRSMANRNLFFQPNNCFEEQLCDAIAAEILMPLQLFRKHATRLPFEVSSIKHLARLFIVSLGAAAIRFSETTRYTSIALLTLRIERSNDTCIVDRVLANTFRRRICKGDSFRNGPVVKAFKTSQECESCDWLCQGLIRRSVAAILERSFTGKKTLCLMRPSGKALVS